MNQTNLESIVAGYRTPLAQALAKLGLPEGDEYTIGIRVIDGEQTLEIAVTRYVVDGDVNLTDPFLNGDQ